MYTNLKVFTVLRKSLFKGNLGVSERRNAGD